MTYVIGFAIFDFVNNEYISALFLLPLLRSTCSYLRRNLFLSATNGEAELGIIRVRIAFLFLTLRAKANCKVHLNESRVLCLLSSAENLLRLLLPPQCSAVPRPRLKALAASRQPTTRRLKCATFGPWPRHWSPFARWRCWPYSRGRLELPRPRVARPWMPNHAAWERYRNKRWTSGRRRSNLFCKSCLVWNGFETQTDDLHLVIMVWRHQRKSGDEVDIEERPREAQTELMYWVDRVIASLNVSMNLVCSKFLGYALCVSNVPIYLEFNTKKLEDRPLMPI